MYMYIEFSLLKFHIWHRITYFKVRSIKQLLHGRESEVGGVKSRTEGDHLKY